MKDFNPTLGQTLGIWEDKKCPVCGFVMHRPPYNCPACARKKKEAERQRNDIIRQHRANGFDSSWDPK